jgi:hypothetical protein
MTTLITLKSQWRLRTTSSPWPFQGLVPLYTGHPSWRVEDLLLSTLQRQLREDNRKGPSGGRASLRMRIQLLLQHVAAMLGKVIKDKVKIKVKVK